jgi:hypothetical protein
VSASSVVQRVRWRLALAVVATLGAGSAAPIGARGDGLPIPGVTAKPGGVATLDGRRHYVARPGPGGTIVRKVDWRTGGTVDSTSVAGTYTVPAVAIDGSPGGLSADGRRLALIRPRRSFPQATTHLVVLGTGSLEVRRRIDLRGDFSFDAISPTGDRIFLIDYLSPHDPTRYAVRAYDVGGGHLLPKPIVDPTEPGEAMRGYPLTRVASPNGRWQYTLYSGGEEPFVHALDTERGRARCIDLPRSIGSASGGDSLRIGAAGETLSLASRRGRTLATIDTSTFEVSKPAAVSGGRLGRPNPTDASTLPWVLIGLGVGLALALAGLWGMPRFHRRRLAGGG